MKNHPHRRDVLWAAAVVCAFGLGLWISPRPWNRAAFSGSGNPALPELSSRVPGGGSASASDGGPGGGAAGADWGKSYRLFSRCQDSVKRQGLMAAALAGITRANWREAWEPMWESRRQGLISEPEWRLFMQRFGAVAGQEVALLGKPADVVTDWEAWNVRAAMEGWAATDASGSWDWISGLPAGNYRRGLMTGWMEGAAAVDPDRALAALQKFDPEKDSAIWAAAAGKMANHDPDKIKAWLGGQSAGPGREGRGWVDGAHDAGLTGKETAETFFNQLLKSKLTINPGDPAYVGNLKEWFDQYSGNPGVPDSAVGEIASALRWVDPPRRCCGGLARIPSPRPLSAPR